MRGGLPLRVGDRDVIWSSSVNRSLEVKHWRWSRPRARLETLFMYLCLYVGYVTRLVLKEIVNGLVMYFINICVVLFGLVKGNNSHLNEIGLDKLK